MVQLKEFESFFVDLTQILDGQENSGQNIFTVKWLQIWVKRSTDLRHSAVKEYNQGANSITVTRSNVTCSVIWIGICGDKSINYFYLQENTCQRYHSLKVQVDLPPERACEGIETRNIIKLEIFNKNDSATILSISVEAAVSSRNKQQENIL